MNSLLEYILDNHEDVYVKKFLKMRDRLTADQKEELHKYLNPSTDPEFSLQMAVIADGDVDWIWSAHQWRAHVGREEAFAYSMIDDVGTEFLIAMREHGVLDLYMKMDGFKDIFGMFEDNLDYESFCEYFPREDVFAIIEEMNGFDELQLQLMSYHGGDIPEGLDRARNLDDKARKSLKRVAKKRKRHVMMSCDPEWYKEYHQLWKVFGYDGRFDFYMFLWRRKEVTLEAFTAVKKKDHEILKRQGLERGGKMLRKGYFQVPGFVELITTWYEERRSAFRLFDDVDGICAAFLKVKKEHRAEVVRKAYDFAAQSRSDTDISEKFCKNPYWYNIESRFPDYPDEVLSNREFGENLLDTPEKLRDLYGTVFAEAKVIVGKEDLEMVDDIGNMAQLDGDFWSGLGENARNGTSTQWLTYVRDQIKSGAVGGGNYRTLFRGGIRG